MVRVPLENNGYFRKVAGRGVIFLSLGLALLCWTAQYSSSALAATAEVVINGAGATFPYPLYAKWGARYHQQSGLKLNYQAIGSGGGIAQIKAKTVDFGASDEPGDAVKKVRRVPVEKSSTRCMIRLLLC